MRRNNDELLANWGNLVNRTLTNAHRNFGAVPDPGELTDQDEALLAVIEAGFDEVGSLIERGRIRAALGEAMRLSSEVNQYVSDTAPWALVKTDRDRAGTVLYVALRAVDSLKTIFTPFLPHTSQTLHELLGYEGWLAGPLEFRDVTEENGQTHQVLTGDYASWAGALAAERAPARPGAAGAEAALRQARDDDRRGRPRRRMIDTHAHLEPSEAREVLDRARERRCQPRRRRRNEYRRSSRRARARAGARRRLRRARHPSPQRRRRRTRAGLAELRELLAHERAVAVGETGLDYFRDYAPRDAQRRLFDGQLAIADELGKPVVIHTRAADEDTLAALAGFDGTVILHCFSSPALLEPALERGWYVSFAGNVTYPKAPELREAARLVPVRTACSPRPTARTSRPSRFAGRRNEPAIRAAHARGARARRAARTSTELEAQIDANATVAFGL